MKKIFLSMLLLSYFYVTSCQAAEVSFEVSSTSKTNSTIPVDLLLDLKNENINSLEMTVTFPESLVSFVGYDPRMGTIPVWIEHPKLLSKGNVHFSGIIPGGLERLYDPQNPTNTSVRIVRLLFKSKTEGKGTFDIQDFLVLRNDGLGTSVPTSITSKSFTVVSPQQETLPAIESVESFDQTPPLPFSITIISESRFGRTPRLAVFNAEDLESGIEHYEGTVNRQVFHPVKSPFPLPPKFFSYTFTVRAFDFFGNYQEQTIKVPGVHTLAITTVFLVVLTGILLYTYKRKVSGKK